MISGIRADEVLLWLTAISAVGILISGVDDLFVDIWYYAFEFKRRVLPSRFTPATEVELARLPQQKIAIMIPTWREEAVIGRMLRNTLKSVDYANFNLFVGVYPNDTATAREVARVQSSDPRVHAVVCPQPGPTNKAHCLNSIVAGIRRFDEASGKLSTILILHDSEDVVHPMSLKLMNRYIPGTSMVQLPVLPIASSGRKLTAGTYLDEFAESHYKDMVVRHRLSGMIPSAGVGTGFSRAALERVARANENRVFNEATFTEDYDLAFRMNAIGESFMYLKHFLDRSNGSSAPAPGGTRASRARREMVGTRGYFPAKFSDAVRQKTRWTLGIVFQGWQQRGWEGGAALRYMIWRDRKSLLTNSVNILGYALFTLFLIDAGLSHWGPGGAGLSAPHIPRGSWIWDVIAVDAALLINRCLQRTYCIAKVSSWEQAALSIPRIVWGNWINFFAVVRASFLFAQTRMTGRKLVWAKTDHSFPTAAQLVLLQRSNTVHGRSKIPEFAARSDS